MNNLLPTKEELKKDLAELTELGKKEYELKKARIEIQHEQFTKQKQELDAFRGFRLGASEKRINDLKNINSDYINSAKQCSVFLGIDDFKGAVPLFPRNLILVGAQTGDGKSTLTANMALQFLRQNKKVLILTNEEHPTDVLNRIVCLINDWSYHDHTSITDDQKAEFDKMYPILSQRIEIIDDSYNGVGGLTTTVEGIKTILEFLKNDPTKYDIIIIDYFQNINSSNKNPTASGFEVLHEVGRCLDLFKNVYNAPIILLSQLKAAGEDDKTPFKERIEGRKSVFNFSTCAIEVKAIKESKKTEWTFRKNRFSQAIGKTVTTGFDKGKYVKYNTEFARKIEDDKVKRTMLELNKKQGATLNKMLGLKEGDSL